MQDVAELPELELLVEAADLGLHPWVHQHVPSAVRREALAEELGFWLNTAAQDLAYAAEYQRNAPHSGAPAAAYLDRWLALRGGAHVLAGPRYLGMDPDLPFVGVSASDRLLTSADSDDLAAAAGPPFAVFGPGFVLVTTADPLGAWPGTRPERRQVVGLLGELRRRATPAALSVSPRGDTDFYDRYQAIHAADVAADHRRARWTRTETRSDLQALAEQGFLFDVHVDGTWAGIVAGEPEVQRGVRGAVVIELILEHAHRGRGFGRHLSTLLAKALPLPDEQALIGTIHADNSPAYRAALSAGRVDVGGEIVVWLEQPGAG